MRRLVLTLVAFVALTAERGHAKDCQKLCNATPGACLLVDALDTGTTGNPLPGLGKLFEKLRDPNTTSIPQIELLSLFELKADPCGRSDTTISAIPDTSGITFSYSAVNSGESCRMGGKFTLPSGRELGAYLIIPKALEVVLTHTPTEILVNQPTEAHPVALLLTLDAFMKDFGGIVRYIEFMSTESFIETDSGCIWVRY